MRFIFSILYFLLISCSASAEIAINLAPMKGESKLDVEKFVNITGSCGESIIRVLGVKEIIGDFYTSDADGQIIVRSQLSKDIVFNSENGLSDHNGTACVTSKFGNRLLIWKNCAGSACGDKYSFIVIDVDRLKILAPTDKIKDCDELCASRLLGNDLPKTLNGQVSSTNHNTAPAKKPANSKYSIIKGNESCVGDDYTCNLLLGIYDDNSKDGSYQRYLMCELLITATPMSNFGALLKSNNDVHGVCLRLMQNASREQMQQYGKTLIQDRSIIKMNDLKRLVDQYK